MAAAMVAGIARYLDHISDYYSRTRQCSMRLESIKKGKSKKDI